jgi:hypothetical protein
LNTLRTVRKTLIVTRLLKNEKRKPARLQDFRLQAAQPELNLQKWGEHNLISAILIPK